MAQKQHGEEISSSPSVNSGAETTDGSAARARELISQGQALLARSHIAAAQRKFRQALGVCEASVGARSHLALTHLLNGEAELAEIETRAVLAAAPDNVLALTTLAQIFAAQRRWHEASRTMVRALRQFYVAFRAGQVEACDLTNAVRMLVALYDDQRIYQLYRRCVRGLPGTWDETVLTWMGIAAFNVGKYRDARWLWRAALLKHGDLADVLDAFLFTVEAVEAGLVPPFALDYRLRPDAIVPDEPHLPAFVKAFALRGMWQEEDPASRAAALDVLAREDSPWVVDFLLSVVRQPELADDVKMKAGVWLLERGVIDEDEPLEMHLEGRLQEVYIEREDAVYTAEIASLLEEAAAAYERGDGIAAEQAYREVLDVDGDCVAALVGLANVCRATGRDEEAEELLTRALGSAAIAPKSLFDSGIHLYIPDTAQLVTSAQGRVESEDEGNDRDAAREPVDGTVSGPMQTPAGRDSAQLAAMRRLARYEREPIDPAWSWDEALARRTQKRLLATARHLQVKNVSKMRKTELASAVAARLRSRFPWVWQTLSEREREALRWIDEQGGIVTLERLRERFGPDEPTNVDWDEEPQTVAMRLQYWGLVFVGRLRGTDQPAAVLLDDTRKLLHDLWQ